MAHKNCIKSGEFVALHNARQDGGIGAVGERKEGGIKTPCSSCKRFCFWEGVSCLEEENVIPMVIAIDVPYRMIYVKLC